MVSQDQQQSSGVSVVCQICTGERVGNPLQGYVIAYEPRECVAIIGERYTGRGDASVHYFARTAAGTWYAFRKSDNRQLRLPTASQLEWRAPEPDPHHKHGPYGIYSGTIQRSQEVAL